MRRWVWTRVPVLAAVAGLLASCVVPRPLVLSGPGPIGVDSALSAEPVWDAALRVYRKRTWSSEADELISAVHSDSMQGRGAPIVLMARRLPSQRPYRRLWLDSLVARGLVVGICEGATPKECPRNNVTAFLSLADPTYLTALNRTVLVHEEALAPGNCNSHGKARVADTVLHLGYRSYGWAPNDERDHHSRSIPCARIGARTA